MSAETKVNLLFHIHSLKEGGGAEHQLMHLVKSLVEHGFIVHIIVFESGGVYWQELVKIEGCFVHCVERSSKWDIFILVKLVRYIRKYDIDLIIGCMLPCNSFASLAARWVGKPALMTQFSSDFKYSFGGEMYLRLDRFLATWLKLPVAYNSFSGLDYFQKIGFPKKGDVVIPSAIHPPVEKSFPKPFEHAPPCRVGMIARLTPVKNFKMMFDALEILINKGYEVELDLYYGQSDKVYENELRAYAKGLVSACRIHWRGGFDEVWDVLSEIDIYCLCSDSEGMSVALMEAMMAGRICVATNVGDAQRMLHTHSGPCGRVVPKGDARKLADAIANIIESSDHDALLGERAREKAIQEYSLESMVTKYKRLFLSILEK